MSFIMQILEVSTENISNNNTMFNKFAEICKEDGVKFNSPNQRF